MNHSTPGLPVHHQLPEFTQTHIHRVSDAIQPSHGTNPGPMMVVHEGDYVELTLKNPKTNILLHNIDFHSSTGALVLV